jgi:hypothetical protein
LAGAAEDIFGVLLSRQKKMNMLGRLVESANQQGAALTELDVSNIVNRARNPSEDDEDWDPEEAIASR